MYKNCDNVYTFVLNKVNYTVEDLGNSIEVYETEDPGKTGFIFDGGMKQFILFINNITDIAEDIGEKNEAKETLWTYQCY